MKCTFQQHCFLPTSPGLRRQHGLVTLLPTQRFASLFKCQRESGVLSFSTRSESMTALINKVPLSAKHPSTGDSTQCHLSCTAFSSGMWCRISHIDLSYLPAFGDFQVSHRLMKNPAVSNYLEPSNVWSNEDRRESLSSFSSSQRDLEHLGKKNCKLTCSKIKKKKESFVLNFWECLLFTKQRKLKSYSLINQVWAHSAFLIQAVNNFSERGVAVAQRRTLGHLDDNLRLDLRAGTKWNRCVKSLLLKPFLLKGHSVC